MMCMDFSQRNNVVSVDGYSVGTPDFEWIHSWWGGIY